MEIRELDLAPKGKRLAAFVIDNFPITFLIALVYFNFFGFEEVYMTYVEDPTDTEARAEFLRLRNQVRDISFFLYLAYCILMEGSEMQATIGKRLMKIKVVHESGNPLSLLQAVNRNISKIISSVVFSIGFIWILFDKKHQGWHDKIAKTFVVNEAQEISKVTITQSPNINAPEAFYSINDGNQHNILYEPTVDKNWVEELKLKPKSEFDEHDHRLCHYVSKLCDDVIKEHNIPDYSLLWNNFTRGQKALWTFSLFNTDTKNENIVEFLKNWPEYVFAVQEIWKEFKIDNIAQDYDELINELCKEVGDIKNFKENIANKDIGWKSSWSMFTSEYNLLETTDRIEAYYGNDEFMEELYDAVSQYIEDNIDQFI